MSCTLQQPPAPPVAHVPGRHSLLWRVAAAFCVVGVALVACYGFRAPLLKRLAAAWIVNEPCTKADAALVLGGGLEHRAFAAAQLYRAGIVQSVLVTRPELSPSAQAGLTLPEDTLARAVLLTNGVPPAAIEMVGTNVTSTRDEAVALRNWAVQTKARSVLIPTDIFHTRRVRWIFSKTLGPMHTKVRVLAIAPPKYTSSDWWRHEEGLIAFQNEVIKYLYYHLKY